jgi:hypothetical protein
MQEWQLPCGTTDPPSEVTRKLETLTGLRPDADSVPHTLPVGTAEPGK